MVGEWPMFFNECPQQVADRFVSEFGSFLQITNDLAAGQPQVIDEFLHDLFR